ncbi:uncharacterized protein ehbp1l1a isoform X3 [Silurus meridionalis]|uniref:uncharacterized protein ehbp1l1a isoform X3 n=1 Tax=Silurus meridionalis TaxID=175797 RepID=UPI001EEBB0AA|nr:uncharacterized protein ehbp1l1a isoform X3 [Silurus meridionalis]
MKGMFALAPTCPTLTVIPGFPFAPKTKVSQSMVNLQPCIPKSSRIVGLQSREKTHTQLWLLEKKPLWEKLSKTESDILDQCYLSSLFEKLDHNYTLKKMAALVPTCPREAQSPGFPSIPYIKVDQFYLQTEPDIISVLNSCPGVALVLGFPSVHSIDLAESSWKVLKNPIWAKPERNTKSIFLSSTTKHYDQCLRIILLAPTCPDKARIPGFPSVTKLTYAMTALLSSCSYESNLPGMPSRKDIPQDFSPVDRMSPLMHFGEKPLKSKTLLVSNDFPTVEDKTVMSTLVYCCPRKARIPGFPSVPSKPSTQTGMSEPNPNQTQIQTDSEKALCETPNKIDKLDLTGDFKLSDKSPEIKKSKEIHEGSPLQKMQSLEEHTAEQSSPSKTHVTTDFPEIDIASEWEVLDAEDPFTENEGSSGLVETIVGVFHKGFETVAAMLHPSGFEADVDSPCGLVDPENTISVKPRQPQCEPTEGPILQKTLHVSSTEPQEFYFPVSLEPYKWRLADSRSETSLCSKDVESWLTGNKEHSQMKKWPPLTEADLHEITQDQKENVPHTLLQISEQTKKKMFNLEGNTEEFLDEPYLKEKGPQNQSAQEISALIQATCNKHRREELRTFSVTSPQKHAGARKDETSQPPQMQETSRNSWLQESSSVEVLKDKRPISPCPNASMASPCGSKINSSLTDESLHTKERVSVVSQTECLSDISQNKTRSIVDDKKLDNSVTIVDKDFTTKPLEQSPTVLPVPLPRVKKRLSASLPDEYSIESGMTEISTGCICASDNNEMSSHAKVSDLSKGSDAENKIKLRKRNQVSPANMSDSEIDMKVITDVQPGKETKDERRPEQTASELQVKSVDQVKPTEPLLPMARVRKRYSASFNDDVPFLHDQGQKEAHPPVPAPRSKKRLSATFPDENTCEAKHGVSFMDQTESTKPLVSGKESSLEFIKKTADGLELGGNKSFSSALVTACPETSSIIYLHPSAEALPVSETATSNVPENVGNIQRQEGRSSEENQDVETTVKNVNQGKGEDKVHLATVSLNETAATLDLKRQAIKILQASLSPGLV